MKILQVFDIFSPHSNGTVTLLYQLLRALKQKGHEVTLYTSNFKQDQEYNDSLRGIKVYPFYNWLNLAGFRIMPDMLREARKGLGVFDIIHLHSYRSFGNVVIHWYAQKYGIPYLIDAHGSMPRTFGRKGLKWLFDVIFGCRIIRGASRFIAETEVGVNEYKQAGINYDRIVLLPPPRDFGEFSQLPLSGIFRHKFNIKEKHIILFLGRIHWIKGLDFLVESFYQLTQCRSDVILVIVGSDDGYKPILEKLIDKLELSGKILFTGFLGGEDKLSALVDADVLVQPSRHEQGAGVPFEAVLCNTSIIVSKDTGAGEDVRKIDAGYLVDYGNRNGLSDMIQYVLDNPSEAASKTKKARDYIVTNLSAQKKVGEYEDLYATCIEENRQMLRRKK